jgi:hypothetical protein
MSTIQSYGALGDAPKGSISNPYTWEEFEELCNADHWYGGYVEGMDYVLGDVVVTSSWQGSGYDSLFWENYHWSAPFWFHHGGGGGGGALYPEGDDEDWPNHDPLSLPPNVPEIYDGALMAGIVYQDNLKNTYKKWLGGRWEILSDGSYAGIPLYTEKTGFKSMLFIQKDDNNNITNCVYAFAGSDWELSVELIKDWKTNINQISDIDIQYRYAIHNAIEFSRIFGDIPLTFVGHSLGGGLASVASMVTGRPAITYNPVGLSDATLEWLENNNYSVDTSNIYGYIMEGDPLTNYQSLVGLTEQGQFRIVENTKNGEPHSIKNMIKCLQPK